MCMYKWICVFSTHLDTLCSRDAASPSLLTIYIDRCLLRVQKTRVNKTTGRKLTLSVSYGKSKAGLRNAVELQIDDLAMGYPRARSAFSSSPGMVRFPPGGVWVLLGFLGSRACLLQRLWWAASLGPRGFSCLPPLVHAASGFVKKQLWRNCWYLEDLWLDVLIALQLQDSWFIITYVRYWWLQGSDSGKQLNALLHLCLCKKPSEQIAHIKQRWGQGTLTWARKLGSLCFSTGSSSRIPAERKETWVFAAWVVSPSTVPWPRRSQVTDYLGYNAFPDFLFVFSTLGQADLLSPRGKTTGEWLQ